MDEEKDTSRDETDKRRSELMMNARSGSEYGGNNRADLSDGTVENRSLPRSYRSSRHGSLRGCNPGSFTGIEFDVEADPVSDRVADQSSGVSVDWVTQALNIRERLMLQEKQNQALNNSSEDLQTKNNEGPLATPEPIIPKRGILKKHAGTYELEKYRKNAMIIFNHQDFLGGSVPSRKGTLRDEESLKATFEMFGFDVESYMDLPKKVLLDKLKTFCAKDFTQYGCVSVAILTHGSKYGYLRAYDTRYSEHEIIECFNVRRNPTLLGKPIIILIQACRGDSPATACNPSTLELDDYIAMDNDPFDDHYSLPSESDMLIFHSSYIGRASARDTLKGSWFIQTLCKQIKLLAAATDFEAICMAVRKEVALEKEHSMIIGNKLAVAKQMPVMTSTLLRLLYLRKYCGYDDVDKDDCKDENEEFPRKMLRYEVVQTPEINLEAVDVLSACDAYLQYLEHCLRLFTRENPEDEVAQSMLNIAGSIKKESSNKLLKKVEPTESGFERQLESRILRVIRDVHPEEAKMVVEHLKEELKIMDHTLHGTSEDKVFEEGDRSRASQMQRRIKRLLDHKLTTQQAFTSSLHPRSPVQQTVEHPEIKTKLEEKEEEPSIQEQLDAAIKWCKAELEELRGAEFGSDLQKALRKLKWHQQNLVSFKFWAHRLCHTRAGFSNEELTLYNQLRKLYDELLSTGLKYLADLDALQDFLQCVKPELDLLSEKEQTELSNWEKYDSPTPESLLSYERLIASLLLRQKEFRLVINRGEELIARRHPATKTIEEHVQVMQSQHAWIVDLTQCLKTHLEHTTQYHNFLKEVKEAEKWIQEYEKKLNSTFSQSEFTLDDGEDLQRGMKEIRVEIISYEGGVSRLIESAQTIRPMQQRLASFTKPLKAETLCAYRDKDANVTIEKGSSVTVVASSDSGRWLVRFGVAEARLPGAVLALPPPCADAQDAASKLRDAYDRVTQLWKEKQLRMRQNVLLATLAVVKRWDPSQLEAMGAEQRRTIKRALNQDAENILAEGNQVDRQLLRLRMEINHVNRLFEEFDQ